MKINKNDIWICETKTVLILPKLVIAYHHLCQHSICCITQFLVTSSSVVCWPAFRFIYIISLTIGTQHIQLTFRFINLAHIKVLRNCSHTRTAQSSKSQMAARTIWWHSKPIFINIFGGAIGAIKLAMQHSHLPQSSFSKKNCKLQINKSTDGTQRTGLSSTATSICASTEGAWHLVWAVGRDRILFQYLNSI